MEYYTFEVKGEKVGYYEQKDEDGVLYSQAFMFVDGQIIENPFWVRYEDGRVLGLKTAHHEWQPFDQPAGVFPTSAINLLLALMGTRKTFSYQAYDEGNGQVTELILERRENRVEAYDGEQLRRYFIEDAGHVIEYGWGGARSVRVGSLAEAVAHTRFA